MTTTSYIYNIVTSSDLHNKKSTASGLVIFWATILFISKWISPMILEVGQPTSELRKRVRDAC